MQCYRERIEKERERERQRDLELSPNQVLSPGNLWLTEWTALFLGCEFRWPPGLPCPPCLLATLCLASHLQPVLGLSSLSCTLTSEFVPLILLLSTHVTICTWSSALSFRPACPAHTSHALASCPFPGRQHHHPLRHLQQKLWCHCEPQFLCFGKYLFYLKVRVGERECESSIGWFPSRVAAIVRGWDKPKPGAFPRSHTWASGPKASEASFNCFLRLLAGEWMRSEAAGTPAGSRSECWSHRWLLCLLCHNSDPPQTQLVISTFPVLSASAQAFSQELCFGIVPGLGDSGLAHGLWLMDAMVCEYPGRQV